VLCVGVALAVSAPWLVRFHRYIRDHGMVTHG
jgi:hypothetical protein